jgi:hypothetical protein
MSEDVEYALRRTQQFFEHNPYNFRVHLEGLYNWADILVGDREMSIEDQEVLFDTVAWHIPPFMAHVGAKLGLWANPGFGYYKTLSLFPAATAALTYWTVGREVTKLPGRTISFTSKHGAYKPPASSHWSYRNPITGM